MRTRRIALLAALVTLVAAGALAGCGSDSDTKATDTSATTGTTGGKDTTVDLEGRTYTVTGLTDAGADRPIVSGTEIALTFEDDRLGVSAGCNSMSGGYTLDGDTLTVSQMASTQMACDDDRMAQDQWLADFLAQPVTVRGSGADLTLTGSDAEVRATEQAPQSDSPLVGTTWVLESIVAGDTVSSAPVLEREPDLTIDDAGRASVFFGCNRGGGDVTVGESVLTFGPMMMTKMACQGPASMVEATIADVLQGKVDYSIEGTQLTTTRGEQGLVWTSA